MTTILFFFAGLAALGFGAELLVRGASRLSLSFGISPLVVGLTVVAFGTSAPEMAVSVGAAFTGKVDVAIGNVVGSNIFNILVILGASALIVPLAVHVQVIRQEVPVMIAATLAFIVFALDGSLAFFEAALLFAALIGYLAFLVVQSRREGKAAADEFADEMPPPAKWDSHWAVQVLLVVAGLALLVVGADWLVDAAVTFARSLGVSDLVIGLTIVAAGTSLPEVAASLTAALRGERDIAVGNVVGSNVFNLLGCLGLAGIAAPAGLPVAPELLRVDLWVMLAATLACLPVFLYRHEIRRWQGGLFCVAYVGYAAFLVLSAQQHALLDAYTLVVLWGALPALGGLLAWMVFNRRRPRRPAN